MADKKIIKLKLGRYPSPQEELNALGKEIIDGFNKEFCGTGKRIDELYGAAKFNAVLRNIGGGDMEDGFKKMCEFFYLYGSLNDNLKFGEKIVLSLEVR